ncbi:ABC transporter ATP-binding protein [Actinospica robiniae]|uniref:ABC transporter ATP-binding protein n=1 Tax=Actinospica robiniae TaxID=304901 RepID=UPI0003F6C9E4|nr:ABC transporter ATP-binding protein [Actinospica robiniae]
MKGTTGVGGDGPSGLLELRGVAKRYGRGAGEVHALRGVDLVVDAGTMVAVMGPSGSGKSSLLTVAGSLEEPSSGEVFIAGRNVAGLSRGERARLRRRTIGFVFQDYNLLAGLTAAENVSMPLELDGVPARKARAEAVDALGRLGLEERVDAFPDELSGGERQRVAIARAVVGGRKLLLADEPSGALDSANGEAVMRLLADACERAGVGAVVVTHDAKLASLAHRVVHLKDGQMVEEGGAVAWNG